MQFGLREEIIENLRRIFYVHPEIERAVVFGSRARGTHKDRSDLDIALFGNVTFQLQVRISVEIDELNLPWKIDILVFKDLKNEELKTYILEEGIELWIRE
ncbi:MAG: nucleotidyltransferase family protein [Chloroflexota bacterium]